MLIGENISEQRYKLRYDNIYIPVRLVNSLLLDTRK